MARDLTPAERDALRGGEAWLDGPRVRFNEDEILDEWAQVLSRRGRPGSPATLAVYVHVPYCRSLCRYCRYGTCLPIDRHQLGAYVDYVVARLACVRQRFGRLRASSLYVGGGTPSLLTPTELERLLAELQRTFVVEGSATLEGHPQSLDFEKIRLAMSYGIDRFSMGVQSTDPSVLASVGRRNPPVDAIEARAHAVMRRGGSVNVDLMIGLPGQTLATVVRDLHWALALGAPSITLYRYIEVSQLPTEVAPVTFADLPWPALIARAVGRGYLPIYDGTQHAASAGFFRVVPLHPLAGPDRLARLGALRHLIRSGAFRRPLPAHGRLMHFTGFDIPSVHIMGFGPRAVSHLFGRAWVQDVTTAPDADQTAVARLTGRRISVASELRQAVAGDLLGRRWIRAAEYRASVGLDPLELLRTAPTPLAAALELRPRRARLRAAHPAAHDLLRWLLPRP